MPSSYLNINPSRVSFPHVPLAYTHFQHIFAISLLSNLLAFIYSFPISLLFCGCHQLQCLSHLHWGSDLTPQVRKVQALTVTSCWRVWPSPRHPNTQNLQSDGMSCGGQLPQKPTDSANVHEHYLSTFNIQNILRPLVSLGRDERCSDWVLTDELSYHSSHYYCILLWPTLQSNWKIMLYLLGKHWRKRTKNTTTRNPTGKVW